MNISPSQASADGSIRPLRRQIGIAGATLLGLGSILGTGVFVSIAIGAAAAGPAVLLAIVAAGLVAACNALSSAQLAANDPVSGGTYEYGYRRLRPSLGFTAGWMFICAKTASAATAALGAAGYAMHAVGIPASSGRTAVALSAVALLTILVLSGVRRSSLVNAVIVSITLVSLVAFVVAGFPTLLARGGRNLSPFFAPVAEGVTPWRGVLEACALMFVAYTGYGRIATLAEEVHDPRRNIPLAIVVTLLISMSLYVAVGLVEVGVLGAAALAGSAAEDAAPLERVAREFHAGWTATLVSIGAVTAMLGVLLNLILGLSRVVLAMGRRGDMPRLFARVNSAAATPIPAVMLVGGLIAALVLIGDVKTTWSFSAFTVLIYYAITNLAAIQLAEDERLYPRWIAWLGLSACLFLAFWVEWQIWLTGSGLILAGLVWHRVMKAVQARRA